MNDTAKQRLLGSDVADGLNVYTAKVGVIGEVEQSAKGNTVLRIGHYTAGDTHWVSGAAHVVLTPAERDALIDLLVAQRDAEAVAR